MSVALEACVCIFLIAVAILCIGIGLVFYQRYYYGEEKREKEAELNELYEKIAYAARRLGDEEERYKKH